MFALPLSGDVAAFVVARGAPAAGKSVEADYAEMQMLHLRVSVEFDGDLAPLLTYETAPDDWTR